jgi:RecA/RadA recombinase
MAEKKVQSLTDKIRERLNDGKDKEFAKTFDASQDLMQIKTWIPLKPFFKESTGGDGFPCGHVTQIIGKPDSGKCHTKGTKVIMADGSLKKVEDIVVGDRLMGPDSKSRNVLALGRGKEELFDVIPNNGVTFGCNKSHILSLVMSKPNLSIEQGKVINVSIAEYQTLNKTLREALKLYRSPLSFDKKEVKYDPYWVGLWLGDGSVGQTDITKDEPDLEPFFEEFAKNNKITYRKRENIERCSTYLFTNAAGGKENPLLNFVRDELVKNKVKRIPLNYLSNSKENRLRLLAGLLDSDGYLNKETGTGFEIVAKDNGLSDDISLLARGLGLRVNVSIKKVQLEGWESPRNYNRISITGKCSEIPTLIKRKQGADSKNNQNELRTGFELSPLGIGEFYGFELDGDHLYLLEDTTVTHNTTLMMEGMVSCQKVGGVVFLIDSEHKFSMSRLELMGGVAKDVIVIQTDTLEQAWTAIEEILKQAKDLRSEGFAGPLMMCWDSIAASVPESIMDSESGDAHMAVEAKMNNKNIRRLRQAIKDTDLALVGINHYYMTVPKSKYEQAQLIVKGGEEFSFMSTLIVHAKQGQKLERTVLGEKQKIGRITKFTIHKGHFHGRTIDKNVNVVDIGILTDAELEEYQKGLRGVL